MCVAIVASTPKRSASGKCPQSSPFHHARRKFATRRDCPVSERATSMRRSSAFCAAALLNGPLSMFRSEEHTSELKSLMRISYAVFRLKKQKQILHKSKHQYTRT